SLSQAARISGVSHRTIERLVEAGLLKCEQVTPRAPWEIRRSDLDAEPIRRIIGRLHRTGKLILQWGCAEDQLALFTENQGDHNARHDAGGIWVRSEPHVGSTAVTPIRATRRLGSAAMASVVSAAALISRS